MFVLFEEEKKSFYVLPIIKLQNKMMFFYVIKTYNQTLLFHLFEPIVS